MKRSFILLAVFVLLTFTNQAISQISTGGSPVSSTTPGISANFETINLIPPDLNQFTQEDIEADNNNLPQRIATNVPVNIDIQTSGTWENINGLRIWRIKLTCVGALALNVQFDAFHLPNGGNLYLYNEEKSQILGAFTSYNNPDNGLFSTELIGGDAVIIEYFEPELNNELVELSVSDLAYAYRNVSYVLENSEDFGDSDWCQVNVNCSPEGDNWQDEKRGVARILWKEGFYWYWCTGSLVNNTLENGTPYFLTADHCGGTASASDRNQWIFYFNYESTGCSNPGSSPAYNSKTGAVLKSRGDISGGSDFQLVQINGTIPSYYNVYYNGWDRSGSSSSSGVGIHHPSGDIKKISTYSSTMTSSTWYGSGYIGATNAHWRTSWIATTNGFGVSEGGSSGSPIFNSSGRVLGTLTGGSTECNDPTWDYYGKFSYHWQSNGSTSSVQLEPWLDPNSSGVTYLDGWDPNAANPPVANFEADDTSPGAGQTVYFTDLSTDNPTSWLWSFSPSTVSYVGGTNSSSQNPQVQFNNTGNYTVTLTAWNAFGSDSETKSNYINVSLFCDASGGANYMYISNVQMGAINNSSVQNYYTNYTSLSTDLSQYQTNVSITVVNGAVYGDEDLGVWIDWNQDDDFYDTGENIVCEIDDDGQGTFTFDVPGSASLGTTTMRVRIKYSGSDCGDPCGTTTYGEVEDYSVNVLAGSGPPVANFEADNLAPAIGETVNFSDLSTNSPTTWQWSFSPASITYVGGTHQNSPNPQVQFNTSGPYTVALSVSNPSGSDMEIKTDYIIVTGPPVAEFEADNVTPTIGETVNLTDLSTNNPTSWQWSFNPSTVTYIGGTNSNSPNPQVQFNAEGYYTAALTVYNASGSDMEIKTDYILVIGPPTADFEADNILPLSGETVNFTDLSIGNPTTWQWSFSPSSITYVGGTNLNSQHPQVQFSAHGTYTVALSVTNPVGSDMEIKTDYIMVIAPPIADFSADNVAPGIGETVSFTDLSVNDPTSWAWSFTPATVTYVGGTTASDQNPLVTFDASGSYTAELIATNTGGSDIETKIDYIFVVDAPVADFEADNVTAGIGETISFTDLSTNNPNSWAWSFTPATVTYLGGTTANDQNPQVSFDVAGNYTVELIATNISGSDTETKVDYIFVIDVPDTDFEADNVTPGIGETISFTDLSTNNPSSWAWTFSPATVTYVGGTTANDQNPQITFDAAGYYTVELTATNVSGSDTEIKANYIFVIDVPFADFEADNVTPGISEMVTFTDLSTNNPTSWTWTFTPATVTYDGGTTANDQNPLIIFDAAGYYTVELTATNVSGSDTEIKADYIFVIDVPLADFEADNVTPGISETVSFTDLSTNNPTSWAWSFAPSTVTYVGGTTPTDQNPQVTFDAAGYYTVELTATNISGGDTETKVDYINVALPYIDLELTVYLEGPANGSLMNTDLLQYIPLNQPFNVNPWYYTGSENVVIVPGTDIVDWVLVELRDAVSPDLAIASTTFDWQAAFIRNDGKIVDLNGNATLHFGTTVTDSLYVAIHHRNHLSIMSTYGLEEDGGIYSYDFSTAEGLAFGENAQKLIGTSIWGMFSGDGNRDRTIDDLDESPIWENEAGENGYLESDYDLNGQSDNSDKNDFWFPNQGEGSQVPD